MDYKVFGHVADQPAIGHLLVRQVNLGLARPLQSAHPDVTHYSNDLAIVQAEGEVATQRLLVWPVLLDERLAHDRHPWFVGGIVVAYATALFDRNSQGREELWADETQA